MKAASMSSDKNTGGTPAMMSAMPSNAGAGGAMASGAGGSDAKGMLNGTGSCCSEHDTPGCGDADLQVCVCEKLPACCTDKWTSACAFLVTQKYCQAGVRDCVCGTGAKQWGQTQCCDKQWSDTCETVAELKCGAATGCR